MNRFGERKTGPGSDCGLPGSASIKCPRAQMRWIAVTVSQRALQRIIADRAVLETLLACLVITLLSGGLTLLLSWLWVLRWTLAPNLAPAKGTLLLCGHRLQAGSPSTDYQQRLGRAAALMDKGPGLRLILLGGGSPSEAAAGREWLLAHTAVNAARITLEQDSVDSLENLRNARELLDRNESLYLLSSRYHLGRLRILAAQLGLNAALIPAEARFKPGWRNLYLSLQEAGYVCWFVCGRGWARLARRQGLLDRIR